MSQQLIEGHDTIPNIISKTVRQALGDTFGDNFRTTDPLITQSKAGTADYQSNIAMSLTKNLGIPPIDIANRLIAHIQSVNFLQSNALYDKVYSSGPGFINFELSQDFLVLKLQQKVADPARIGIPLTSKKERVVVDFSSPNIAKEMHVVSLINLNTQSSQYIL